MEIESSKTRYHDQRMLFTSDAALIWCGLIIGLFLVGAYTEYACNVYAFSCNRAITCHVRTRDNVSLYLLEHKRLATFLRLSILFLLLLGQKISVNILRILFH